MKKQNMMKCLKKIITGANLNLIIKIYLEFTRVN